MTVHPIRLLLPLALLLAGPLAARADLPLHASPLNPATAIDPAGATLRLPPPHALPGVRIHRESDTWDGMPISYRVIAAGPLKIRIPWETFSTWGLPEHAGPHGITGRPAQQDDLTLRLVLLPGGGPLGNLDEDTWDAYLAGTIGRPDKADSAGNLLCNDNSEENQQMLRLMGGRTRVAVIEQNAPGNATRRTVHVGIARPAGILLVTLEGPAASITHSFTRLQSLLTDIEPSS